MQEADIGLLADGFVGREWLHTTLDEWRRHSKDSRLFWLSGAAGTGKSAFAAWLAHRGIASSSRRRCPTEVTPMLISTDPAGEATVDLC